MFFARLELSLLTLCVTALSASARGRRQRISEPAPRQPAISSDGPNTWSRHTIPGKPAPAQPATPACSRLRVRG